MYIFYLFYLYSCVWFIYAYVCIFIVCMCVVASVYWKLVTLKQIPCNVRLCANILGNKALSDF